MTNITRQNLDTAWATRVNYKYQQQEQEKQMSEATITIPVEVDREELWSSVMGSAWETFGDHWQEYEYISGDWDNPDSKVRLVCHNDKYENVEKVITIDDLAKALPIANKKVYMDLFDFDNYDAVCGDAVLQVAVIGDVVFG